MYAVILAKLKKYEEQLNNNLKLPQEVKLHGGIRNVITLRDIESKSFHISDLSFLSVCIQACGGSILMKI